VFRIIIVIIAAVAPNSSQPQGGAPPSAFGTIVVGDGPARNQVAPEPLALQAVID
jgi:hypothetical protein